MAYYKSPYTGEQIDQAVGIVLENDIVTLAAEAKDAALRAEDAAVKAESVANGLPAATTSDAGKVLTVLEDGTWGAAELPTYSGEVEVS